MFYDPQTRELLRAERTRSPEQINKHQTVTVLVPDTALAIELRYGDTKVVRRTTTQPVRSIKGQWPRTATSVSQAHDADQVAQIRCTSGGTRYLSVSRYR